MSGQFLPDRWNELAPLLDAALEREPADRPAFLDRASAGDTVLRALGPGRAEKLGLIPRRVSSVSVSKDLKRAAVVVRDYRGDAWMSLVVRR